ncbi:tRNA-dihydrouridine synthase [Nocardioides rotundus]|uniref:tRNA-dihydrouridine synthase n=1 Tax=Nocardioides rotundus TaxID=1774216 RepID=UPI001CC00254|nr:tRNA-dihydrouridine synthase [Nocardioides rotundus]UAL31312.1 tRNA-dihydrouridine synthase [Nocardioides rotundus]
MSVLEDLRLRGPVLTASGCGGTGRELAPYVDLATLGGFVTRSITLAHRTGAAGRRIVETPSGLLNAVGLQNPGLEPFLARELPWLHQQGARVIVSIAGASPGEYADLAQRLAVAPGVSGIEVNLSAPDQRGSGVYDVREPFHAGSVVSAVRRETPSRVPVLAKLRSDVVRAVEVSRTVAEAGADAVVLGNALPAAMPDGRPARLSGPAVGPLALRCVAQVCQQLPALPVIGCGGIATPADVRAFLDAGAVAVQVGTAQLHDPMTLSRLITARQEDA